MDFTERTELERGFAEVFRARVAPALRKIEKDRVARLATARKWLAICALGGIALGAVIYFAFDGTGVTIAAVAVALIGIVAGFVVRGAQSSAWSGAVEKAVMPAICDHVGDLEFSSAPSKGVPVEAMRQLGLFGSYDRTTLRDELRGSYRGTNYELVEAHLTKQTRDSDNDTKTTTVFRGLLFHIAVPVAAPGPILIARDFGAVGNTLGAFFSGKSGRGMPRVPMDHEGFEQAFEVHAEDPEGARGFLPPAFLDALLEIGEEEGGKKGAKSMVAGFEGQSFYLALQRGGEFMRMGSLSKSVTEMEDDLHAIFADIAVIRRIIDRLHGDRVQAA